MVERPELPLNGYYRCGPTYVDSYLFLRLDPDGFCLFHQSQDEAFDFPAYVAALDVESIKQQYPRGHSKRNEQGVWQYSVCRYVRKADVPVISYGGEEVCRYADALVLTSWEKQLGDFELSVINILGPGRLQMPDYDGELLFVPNDSKNRLSFPQPS